MLYTKKVQIGNFLVKIRAKAGEYPNGKIVLLPKLSAYTFTIQSKKIKNQTVAVLHNEQSNKTTRWHSFKMMPSNDNLVKDSVYFDDIQEQATFEILEIETIPTTDIYRKQINALFRRYGL